MQRQPDCDTRQVVTATGDTALRFRGTTRAEENSALTQSVVLMASVPDLPLPLAAVPAFSLRLGQQLDLRILAHLLIPATRATNVWTRHAPNKHCSDASW
jgi:hypothetical protein